VKLKLVAENCREEVISYKKANQQLKAYKVNNQDARESEVKLIAAESRLSYLERVIAAQTTALRDMELSTMREIKKGNQSES
jgi:hypothetical protein